MQGHSDAFDETLRRPHTAVCAVELITDGKVIRQLEVHAGSVTADRTAAQMRSFSVDIIDRDGDLLPTDMTSELAPFGARVQLYRGVRISSTDTVGARYDAAHPWGGVLNGVKIDVDGGLVLGL